MLDKFIKKPEKDDIEENWSKDMEIASASTEQLSLYRTQTLIKLDISIRALAKNVRTVKNLLIAIFVLVLIIALLM